MFAEGWALYQEQQAPVAGAKSENLAQLRRLQLKALRIAHSVVDAGVHTGRISEKDALKLLTDRLGLTSKEATREMTASADAPGGHLGYMGMVELLRIHDEMRERRGARFSLADFHERLLAIGPLPLALVRAALLD